MIIIGGKYEYICEMKLKIDFLLKQLPCNIGKQMHFLQSLKLKFKKTVLTINKLVFLTGQRLI